jgi:hypothetical protein
MATRHHNEQEDRDVVKQDEPNADPAAPDPSNDPQHEQRQDQRRDQRRDQDKGRDEKRLPSSALTPQEKHDRDIEDLKKAGHDFQGPDTGAKRDKDNPEDPHLRDVTVQDRRTRRDDGLDVPPVPGSVDVSSLQRDPAGKEPTWPPGGRSAMDNPQHPLHHLKDA